MFRVYKSCWSRVFHFGWTEDLFYNSSSCSSLSVLPLLHLRDVLVQFEGLRIRECATVLDVHPGQDLLDRHLHLLAVDGVRDIGDGEDYFGYVPGAQLRPAKIQNNIVGVNGSSI